MGSPKGKKGLRMRFFPILCLAILLCACNHNRVMNRYKEGNTHARDLLLHGLNEKNADYLDEYLLNQALHGDEEAKNIIYAQIDTLRGIQKPTSTYIPIVVPITSGRR